MLSSSDAGLVRCDSAPEEPILALLCRADSECCSNDSDEHCEVTVSTLIGELDGCDQPK